MDEARRIWGDALTDKELREWIRARNFAEIRAKTDPVTIPKGCTIPAHIPFLSKSAP
jgi:hypothetical protein